MLETAADMMERNVALDDYRTWFWLCVALLVAWCVFLAIREFWCWYCKTSAIASELKSVNDQLQRLQMTGRDCWWELAMARGALERIAKNASSAASRVDEGAAGSGKGDQP
jgi:hypothetical protein